MSERMGMEKEIADLRTEVYEARTLIIKSDNLLRTLHSELKAVAKTQERFEKRHVFTGVAAYVLFAVLAAGGALWVGTATSKSGREAAESRLTDAAARVEVAEQEALEAREALDARMEAEHKAAALHRGITSEDPEEQMRALEELESSDMSLVPPVVAKIIDERAMALRRDIVSSNWDKGRRAFLAERMDEAAAALALVERHGRALPADYQAGDRATAAYYLGAAQNRLGNHEEAARVLLAYVGSDLAAQNTLAFASQLLGESLSEIGRVEEARQAFTKGLEVEPAGRHAQAIRRRLDNLATADEPGANSN